jgi:isoleucyl-tRNA synthetase
LASADAARLLNELQDKGFVEVQLAGQLLQLTDQDVEVRLKAKSGWAAAQGRHCVVVLSTDLTPTLIREGYARDLVRFIQDSRKQLNCQFTDRIAIYLVFQDSDLSLAIEENKEYIVEETLSSQLVFGQPPAGALQQSFELAGQVIQLAIEVIPGQP